jgi:hypothetical protein
LKTECYHENLITLMSRGGVPGRAQAERMHHLANDQTRTHVPMTAINPQSWKLSGAAVAEAMAVIQALSPLEPDLASISEALEALPIQSFAPDRTSLAWRWLYLSLYTLPRRVVLVGSIDATPELADLTDDTAGLLIVETDVLIVSTAELLPRGTQWRSLTEFGVDLDAEDRVQLTTALVNGLQPPSVLVMGSRAGWEMLARHGRALRSNADLFAAIAASPDLSAVNLLGEYLRKCIPVLSTLYGPGERALRRIADLFELSADQRGKLRDLRDWRDDQGFLSAPGTGK